MRYLAIVGEREIQVEVTRRGSERYLVRLDGEDRHVECRRSTPTSILTVDGKDFDATIVPDAAARGGSRSGEAYTVVLGGRSYSVRLEDPLRGAARSGARTDAGRIDVCSVMPGKVTNLLVREGDEVRAGQGLVVIEAMKMENEIAAPKAGRVVAISVQPGEPVYAGSVLLSLE